LIDNYPPGTLGKEGDIFENDGYMLADKIIAYENGELDEEEVIELFQELVNNGTAWSLQGAYGRMAKQLIEEGLIVGNYTNN